jgi:hypothetical protein
MNSDGACRPTVGTHRINGSAMTCRTDDLAVGLQLVGADRWSAQSVSGDEL